MPKLIKIAMLIQAVCITVLVLVCVKLPSCQTVKASPIQSQRFIDVHAHDRFQVVIYPHTKKQQIYFCYEYTQPKYIGRTTPMLLLHNMQGEVIHTFDLPMSEYEIFGTDVNIDDTEIYE